MCMYGVILVATASIARRLSSRSGRSVQTRSKQSTSQIQTISQCSNTLLRQH